MFNASSPFLSADARRQSMRDDVVHSSIASFFMDASPIRVDCRK